MRCTAALGRFHFPSFRKPNVDHELIALREREESLRNMLEYEHASDHRAYARGERNRLPVSWRQQSCGCIPTALTRAGNGAFFLQPLLRCAGLCG